MAEQELESRIVTLADGDEVEIHGPFEDPLHLHLPKLLEFFVPYLYIAKIIGLLVFWVLLH